MRTLIFVFVFTQILNAQQVGLQELRSIYVLATLEEEQSNKLFDLTESATIKSDYIAYGYHAAAYTLQSKHTLNPLMKFTYFKEGKNKLEQVIDQYPNELELRFLRYCIQKNIPDFLDYSSNLKQDSIFIIEEIINSDKESQSYILPIFKTINNGRTSNTG
jgi:hypothetical protein